MIEGHLDKYMDRSDIYGVWSKWFLSRHWMSWAEGLVSVLPDSINRNMSHTCGLSEAEQVEGPGEEIPMICSTALTAVDRKINERTSETRLMKQQLLGQLDQ